MWLFRKIGELFTRVTERVTSKLVFKLILLFTSIIVLIVVSLTVISYKMMEKEAVNNSIISNTNNLRLVNQNMEGYLAEIEQLSLPQIRYDEITSAILNEKDDYASQMFLEDYLRSLYFSRNDLEGIYLYLVDQDKYYSITREAYNIRVRVTEDASIKSRQWYTRVMENEKNRTYQSFLFSRADDGYTNGEDNSFMAYHRVLRSIVTRAPQAVISFYFNSSVKDEIMKDAALAEEDHLILLGSDHQPYHVDDPLFYEQFLSGGSMEQLGEEEHGEYTWVMDTGQKYLVVYNVGQQEGWKLVKPIPYSRIYETATRFRSLSFMIGLIFLVTAVLIVIYTSSAITKPLKTLAFQMRRFSSGSFDAEARVYGRDEIAYLTKHFNQMVHRTNELINERYKMKLAQKNAILKALEAEINPHFLYNALQAISTKALKNNMLDVVDMVDALALTLRYCISGKDIVSASEELGHIERYLGLQKARFGSRLQVELDWDTSLLKLQIPKLSVQTLVENSIKHALEKVSKTVVIHIQAELGTDQAIISVADNGPGIEAARLAEIRALLEQDWEEQDSENIGLKNLNTRLQLLYGERAKLMISTSESGTTMQMVIPRIKGGNMDA